MVTDKASIFIYYFCIYHCNILLRPNSFPISFARKMAYYKPDKFSPANFPFLLLSLFYVNIK